MIIKDENDSTLSVHSLSDITKEINEIEAIFSKAIANKKKGGSMPADEKEALTERMKDLNVIVSSVSKDMLTTAKAVEVVAFLKALNKLKKLSETDLSEFKND